jgi:hypothetical protein
MLGLCFVGSIAVFLASYGHYLNLSFPEYSGGDSGLIQRAETLMLAALVLLGVASGLATFFEFDSSKQSLISSFSSLLFSWGTLGLIVFAAIVYGLSCLGDVGQYLILVGFFAVPVVGGLIDWAGHRRKPTPAADGLTTMQLTVLWYGTVLAAALCGVWAAAVQSIGPLIPSVIMVTVVLALSVSLRQQRTRHSSLLQWARCSLRC